MFRVLSLHSNLPIITAEFRFLFPAYFDVLAHSRETGGSVDTTCEVQHRHGRCRRSCEDDGDGLILNQL